MKKLFIILLILLTSSVFSQQIPIKPPQPLQPIERMTEEEIEYHEEKIEYVISFYGYDALVTFDEDKKGPYLYIEVDGDYSEYDHITFLITIVRALYKYSEYYDFIFSKYITRIDFISGDIESELLREEFIEAAEMANSKDQQEYLNEQRSLK